MGLHRQVSTELPRAAVSVWPEMGQMLGVGRGLAYELVNSGRIRVVRLGSRILVPTSAIDDFLSAEAAAQDAA
jgi:excisionase family DNA binding protein